MTDIQEAIEVIIAEFEWFDGLYKREAVDGAIMLRDDITPHLIRVLEKVLASPEVYAVEHGFFQHIYASILLGHFRAEEAHNTIIDLLSLPEELTSELFGDLINSDMPLILLRTSNGNMEKIKELARNTNADIYCRDAALRALMSGVIKKEFQREDVITFLGTLFTGDEAPEGSDFWSIAALHANDLYPDEIMDKINGAYDSGLISEFFIDREEFENVLSKDKDEWIETLLEDPDEEAFEDVHKVMEWWDCFNMPPGQYERRRPVTEKERNRRKKKKKLAAKSKKKNQKKKRKK